ncbi:MAG: outer membrane lipoprotein-sorting protein [Bacteroidia bacterium]|nr:outer membrane lipoprotein-sorting protein [Bacteroidia bacterium]
MRTIILYTLHSIVILLTLSNPLDGQNATEIIKAADEKRRGESAYAEMTISIVRPGWTRDMTLKSWAIGDEYSMILVTKPPRDKGTVFLKRDKEIWNWVPSIERNIKLPPSMMMQSWMGSDFTNDDLIKESSIVEDYTHAIVGDSIILDRECWKIELIPYPEAPVVWGKIYSWISKKDLLELRAEMYDEDGYLINEILFDDIRDLGGKMLPSVMEYIPVDKPGHKTVMSYHKIDFDMPIKESFFTTQNIKRLR